MRGRSVPAEYLCLVLRRGEYNAGTWVKPEILRTEALDVSSACYSGQTEVEGVGCCGGALTAGMGIAGRHYCRSGGVAIGPVAPV